jgi:hypothetical protein
MRKKLSILLVAMVLTLMSAVPGVAQVEPDLSSSGVEPDLVTVCIIKDAPLGDPFGFLSAGTTAELPAELAEFLIELEFATRGPCGDGGGGDGGGGNGGGGNGGGGNGGGGGGATPITQEGEQDSEAGEIGQSFEVS